MERENLTQGQKNSMLLSKQTIAGLTISVNSITECTKFLLDKGADFVLTHHFNQDPLEHFGHYRHKGGANSNSSVYEVRNMMTQLRAVGAQALNPKGGNVTCNNADDVINHTKLPRC